MPGLRDKQRAAGSILLLVLAAVAIMSLAVGIYLANMQSELRASRFAGRRLQTRVLAESAAEYLSAILSLDDEELEEFGGLYDNPTQLQSVVVVDDTDPELTGRFAVVAYAPLTGGLRFGLENESAKLNINSLLANDEDEETARDRLTEIPGIDDEIADAILDWIDSDNTPRTFGVEESYYSSLDPPYEPANRPLAALDELLAVRGITPELLYGLDTNRNFTLDPGETARGVLAELDTSTGLLDRGISAYLTVRSLKTPTAPSSGTLINLNGSDLQELYNDLKTVIDDADAKFIIAYRQGDTVAEGTPSAGSEASTFQINFNQPAKREITSLLDLVGVRVQISEGNNQQPGGQQQGGPPQGGQQQTKIVKSPWDDQTSLYRDKLPRLLGSVSLGESATVAGQIDVNQASRYVLLSVDGIDSQTADQIISRREPVADLDDYHRYPLWLLADRIVDLETMRKIEPFLTVGGDVYTAQAVGYFGSGRPMSRIAVTLDRNGGEPQLIGWQDLSPLGGGYDLVQLGEEPDETQ